MQHLAIRMPYIKIHIKKKLKHCRIINFGSIYGMVSPDFRIYEKNDRFNSEIYGASKASIIQMTKYLGVMYAKKNIFINCISPGGTIDPNKRLSKTMIIHSVSISLLAYWMIPF